MRTKPSPLGSARLFGDPQPPKPPAGVHIANIDGASRGNPGPAAYAVVLRNPEGKVVLELGKRIGRETNNVAEYYALLAALDYAVNQGIQALRIRSDSELLVRQMQGRYKVKSAELKPLYERALKTSRQLNYFAIEHVRREQNSEADALANVALDSGDVSSVAAKNSERVRTVGETSSAASAAPDGRQSGRAAAPVPAAPAARPVSSEGWTFLTSYSSFSQLVIRARVENGVLVPTEPVDLPEGAEIEATLRVPRSTDSPKK